jgi:hypothetical protein
MSQVFQQFNLSEYVLRVACRPERIRYLLYRNRSVVNLVPCTTEIVHSLSAQSRACILPHASVLKD